jgi:hypothetical protein
MAPALFTFRMNDLEPSCGEGFIGSHIVDRLVQDGVEVTVSITSVLVMSGHLPARGRRRLFVYSPDRKGRRRSHAPVIHHQAILSCRAGFPGSPTSDWARPSAEHNLWVIERLTERLHFCHNQPFRMAMFSVGLAVRSMKAAPVMAAIMIAAYIVGCPTDPEGWHLPTLTFWVVPCILGGRYVVLFPSEMFSWR